MCNVAAIFILADGVCIPNTWRRCVLVVAGLWSVAPFVWVAGALARKLPWLGLTDLSVLASFGLLTVAGVLAVYGSHRIESLRHAAVQARRLGQYILRKRIGCGGMGEVYLADHVLLRRPCAIKVIRRDYLQDPSMLQRFEREAQATATLTHPNVVQVFDCGRAPVGTFYYVMEYLPGPTLHDLVKQDGPLSPARAVHFLRQLCGALAEAHSIGLIHRDIKPGNVIVCVRGQKQDVANAPGFRPGASSPVVPSRRARDGAGHRGRHAGLPVARAGPRL